MSSKTFYTYVAGAKYPNPGGSSRQAALRACHVHDRVNLVPCPIPEHDKAVKVCRESGEQIGWLPRELAEDLFEDLRTGEPTWRARVAKLVICYDGRVEASIKISCTGHEQINEDAWECGYHVAGQGRVDGDEFAERL